MTHDTHSPEEQEIADLLRQALARLKGASRRRQRVIAHVESALACLRDPRDSIRPQSLNSANDG